jgi:polygalacturonase
MLGVASLLLTAAAMPASAATWWSSNPAVSIGSTVINVRNAGALGDGRHNDTAAFQAAINALPSTGGTITVPAGTYMIDALTSINMRSHTRLKLDPMAKLVAIPNSSERSHVIKVWRVNNVEILGGSIVGERVGHKGSTGEWGYGVNIEASSNVYLHDTNISNCWGDGIWIGAIGKGSSAVVSTGVTVNHVVSTNNRRQGLSIGPVNGVYVVNSTFSNSNGTAPQAGIDIEPQSQGIARNVRIENSVLTGNRGNGLEVHANVTGLAVKGSTLKSNYGFGAFVADESHGWIVSNNITENGLYGVRLAGTTRYVDLVNNNVTWNSTKGFIARNASIYTKVSGARDIVIASTTSNINVSGNTISPKP